MYNLAKIMNDAHRIFNDRHGWRDASTIKQIRKEYFGMALIMAWDIARKEHISEQESAIEKVKGRLANAEFIDNYADYKREKREAQEELNRLTEK